MRKSPAEQFADQVKSRWSEIVSPDGTFVLGQEHPCKVTINGIMRKFAIRKDSGAGPIKLRTQAEHSYGSVFVHYQLKGTDLQHQQTSIATPQQIAAFQELFAEPNVEMLASREAIETACMAELERHGWVIRRPDHVAIKPYTTAVGQKDAICRLVSWNDDSAVHTISAEYLSEGRNALAATTAWIPKQCTRQDVATIIQSFCELADHEVGQTYAAKLSPPKAASLRP